MKNFSQKIRLSVVLPAFILSTVFCCNMATIAHANVPNACCDTHRTTQGTNFLKCNPQKTLYECDCKYIAGIIREKSSNDFDYNFHHFKLLNPVGEVSSDFSLNISFNYFYSSLSPKFFQSSIPLYLSNRNLRL